MAGKLARWRGKLSRESRASFSECGEDLIIEQLLSMHDITTFQYLDLGANDPVRGNDFYRAYLNGNSGICIDPLPHLSQRWKKRRRDKFINGAFLESELSMTTLFVHEQDRLSSLIAISSTAVEVPVVRASELLNSFCDGIPLVLKVDIEGGDLEIAKSLVKLFPHITLMVIETFEGLNDSNQVVREFEEFISKEFRKCAFTPLNSFYFNRSTWKFNRP